MTPQKKVYSHRREEERPSRCRRTKYRAIEDEGSDMKTEEREVKSGRRYRKKCRAIEERRRDPAGAAERRVEL